MFFKKKKKEEEKKAVADKPATSKQAAKKTSAKKPAAKKPAAKKPEKKSNTKVYHVSKRASDGLWVIKFAGGEKVIKTFATKQEAVDYADLLAKSQEGVVLTHASKGAKQGKINAKRSALK